jgi:hypothetical protein
MRHRRRVLSLSTLGRDCAPHQQPETLRRRRSSAADAVAASTAVYCVLS